MSRILRHVIAEERQEVLKRIQRLSGLVEDALAGTLYHGLAYAEIGDLLLQMGCYDEARKAYERAVEFRDDEWFLAWIENKIARSYLLEGKFDEAMRLYSVVVGKYSGQVREVFRARLRLWQMRIGKMSVMEAANELGEIFEGLIDGEADAYKWGCELIGKIIYDVAVNFKEPLKWIGDVVRGIDEVSRDACAMCLNRIGYQFLRAKRYGDAKGIFGMVVERYEKSEHAPEAYLRLGYLSLREGKRRDATGCFYAASVKGSVEIWKEATLRLLSLVPHRAFEALLERVSANEVRVGEELRSLARADIGLLVKVLKSNGGGVNKHRAVELINKLLEMELANEIAIELL
ncbi:MAG TPA: tetratricopeptide repeat protein, partial [Armatimonadetes bacterium]|nr:tetratricopeptide repeat protein [Armatimonadota bacterium]